MKASRRLVNINNGLSYAKNLMVNIIVIHQLRYISPYIGYNVTYNDDKKYGKSVYFVTSDVKKIATEIITNGPVQADFTVYADFTSYKSGKCNS